MPDECTTTATHIHDAERRARAHFSNDHSKKMLVNNAGRRRGPHGRKFYYAFEAYGSILAHFNPQCRCCPSKLSIALLPRWPPEAERCPGSGHFQESPLHGPPAF